MIQLFLIVIFLISFFIFTPQAFAHEAYVLTRQEFTNGLQIQTVNAFAPLFDTSHLTLFIIIGGLVGISYALVLLLATTSLATLLDKQIKKAKPIGELIIRLTIGISFFYAAQFNSFLGPEISLNHMYGGTVIRFISFMLSLTISFGVFTEISGFIAVFIFLYACYYFGAYLITYLNYFAEFLVLFLFGSKIVSFDTFLFGKKPLIRLFKKIRKFETPIIRILYGSALTYAGYSVKFVHQNLTISVYNQYHLQNFFHANASFIAAGAGLSEIMIGLFIIFGFAMRWTILLSLVFITLSLSYFHEMLWPHLILYGTSFYLLINSSDFLTSDHYFIPWIRKTLRKV